ncbi:hypothetical protein [Nocardia otitidiscaviarum]|uniref:hypothetical protein n=1 Tax=Nocardia otitidiscaviarum TaxID=1823 RepID=UPI001895FE8B|nr:hypothetical protein [Nocardia otitidiscaviarum]MBF6240933.1 hypothetical protein [Nocardia otitidiscaviarum]
MTVFFTDTGRTADPAAVPPLTERIRAAFDSAETDDRTDRTWTPLTADDDFDCLAY